jgi:hypothetical protein
MSHGGSVEMTPMAEAVNLVFVIGFGGAVDQFRERVEEEIAGHSGGSGHGGGH